MCLLVRVFFVCIGVSSGLYRCFLFVSVLVCSF